MSSSALDHLLRTMAAVNPAQRVLLRAASQSAHAAHAARPLARMGFEMHVATSDDEAARRVYRAVGQAEDATGGEAAAVYTTAAPLRALPYPEGHFSWCIVQVQTASEAASAASGLTKLLAEARHHVRPGGWVFVMATTQEPAEAAPPLHALQDAAAAAGLAEAEAPAHAARAAHAIYRRVDEQTAV